MIGRLRGVVAEIDEHAIIDVAGVGYEVFMPVGDLARLSAGATVTLVIETVVREDMIRLYGFTDQAGRDWFRALQSVQGIGAKVALGVLSTLPPAELAAAIATADKAAVARAPGVGKRVAERIVAELSAKAPTAVPAAVATRTAPPADESAADAVSALVNLGYDPVKARETVARLRQEAPEAGAAELIRGGLKALAA